MTYPGPVNDRIRLAGFLLVLIVTAWQRTGSQNAVAPGWSWTSRIASSSTTASGVSWNRVGKSCALRLILTHRAHLGRGKNIDNDDVAKVMNPGLSFIAEPHAGTHRGGQATRLR